MSPSTIEHRDSRSQESNEPKVSAGAPPRKSRRWLRTGVPTLLVIGILGGIAIWGHSTDWSLPKFSALVTGGDTRSECPAEGEGWCKEHNVPEAQCIECNAAL